VEKGQSYYGKKEGRIQVVFARDEENGRIRIRLEEVKENPQILHFADVDHFIGFLLTEPPAPERPAQKITRKENN
jgi:hypothetical protein